MLELKIVAGPVNAALNELYFTFTAWDKLHNQLFWISLWFDWQLFNLPVLPFSYANCHFTSIQFMLNASVVGICCPLCTAWSLWPFCSWDFFCFLNRKYCILFCRCHIFNLSLLFIYLLFWCFDFPSSNSIAYSIWLVTLFTSANFTLTS
jgi:hypothetical protein